MELEEEGNKHVEEEIEGEGEEKEEEKREWEELSEKACMLVLMMEKMKNRREGKKNETLKMIREGREEERKKREEAERGREEERRGREEEKKKREEAERGREEAESKLEEERKGREEEKRKREESERTAELEKKDLEDRLNNMSVETEKMKKEKEDKKQFDPNYRKIVHLANTQTATFGNAKISGDTVSVTSDNTFSNCRIGQIYSRVCISIFYIHSQLSYCSTIGSSSTVFLLFSYIFIPLFTFSFTLPHSEHFVFQILLHVVDIQELDFSMVTIQLPDPTQRCNELAVSRLLCSFLFIVLLSLFRIGIFYSFSSFFLCLLCSFNHSIHSSPSQMVHFVPVLSTVPTIH